MPFFQNNKCYSKNRIYFLIISTSFTLSKPTFVLWMYTPEAFPPNTITNHLSTMTIRFLVCYDICFFFNQILNNFKTMTIPACSMKMSITLSTLASISGRFSIRYFTIERWPFSCNKKRSLLKFVFASISAPFSLKYWRILSMVLAKWRGLHWYLSFASILLHVSIRYYTTGRWPFTHAIWRVVPSSHLSFASILVPFSIRYWTG